ncbi:MAG: putative ABC transporter permease [Oscillospiraceae bacterium]
MDKILLYIAFFFFYSFIGWILECIWCTFSETRQAHRFVFINRGFLAGPLCPIYGCSALSMTIFLQPFAHNLIIVFFLGIVVCDLVEYLTSYIMEKIFNARWWDYSNRFMNLHGRICLEHTVIWGILSVIFIRFINPSVTSLIQKIPQQYFDIAIYVLLAIFIIDFLIAVIATIDINVLRSKIKSIRSASLDDSDVEVVEVGSSGNNNVFERISDLKSKIKSISFPTRLHIKRILREYPSLKAQIRVQLEELKDIPVDIKEELKDIQNEIKNRFLFDDDVMY